MRDALLGHSSGGKIGRGYGTGYTMRLLDHSSPVFMRVSAMCSPGDYFCLMSRGATRPSGHACVLRGLLGVLTASSHVRYRPRPHARTRSFQMARSGPGDAARNPVVRRLRAATRSRFASDAHPARHCDTPTMRTWEMRRHTSSIASVHAVSIPNGVTGDERCGPCPTWERRRHRGEFRGAIEPAALTHFCSGISPDYTASSGLRWRIVKEGLR